MIARDGEGNHCESYIEDLEGAFWAPVKGSQKTIANWYENMHDAYLTALRINWIEVTYFYSLLPMFVNGCHYDPERMKLWKVLQISQKPLELPVKLLESRKIFDKPTPDHFVYNGKKKVNLDAFKKVDDLAEVAKQMMEGSKLYERYTMDILAQVDKIKH